MTSLAGEKPASATLPQDYRYIVVSADGHVGPSVNKQLREYCPREYLETFEDFVLEHDSQDKAQSTSPVSLPESYIKERAVHASVPGLQDPHARLRDMDADGIAADVIYHGGLNQQSIPFSSTSLLSWSSPKYVHLEHIGIRMYNRWLADFVSVAPHRHVGIAHVPIHDVDLAVKEVYWAGENGLRAINLPAPRRDFPNYHERIWDPLWAASAETGLSLNTHAGAGDLYPYTGDAATALFLMESQFYARRPIWILIFSGVFARHPGLRLVSAEQFGDWVPDLLNEMDTCYLAPQTTNLREILGTMPSDVWRENCFVGASFMSNAEAKMGIEHNLVEKLMWGADYPHIEGTWPRTMQSIRKSFADLPTDVVAAYLGESAINVYGLDRDALRLEADRIGPTVAKVSVPLDEIPSHQGFAFRELGRWA
jgi:predicted TIM-barrel fold metal-dependent hydrolase